MLETKRLILRKFNDDDLDAYYHILKQASVYQWLGQGTEKSKDHVKKVIDYDLKHWNQYQLGTFAVELKATGELIGHCGFNYIKDLDDFELLYAFGEDYWYKGYATEAAKACLVWLKQSDLLKKIVALSYPNNHRSIKVIEKLGFNYQSNQKLFGVDLKVYQLNI